MIRVLLYLALVPACGLLSAWPVVWMPIAVVVRLCILAGDLLEHRKVLPG